MSSKASGQSVHMTPDPARIQASPLQKAVVTEAELRPLAQKLSVQRSSLSSVVVSSNAHELLRYLSMSAVPAGHLPVPLRVDNFST